ncbi:Signal transduction histidine kinase [Hymenobacter daecheongensis DSM 21074]|uniref:histidine kinase n=1 Tax=Hymenobacter daecheongensis DSM 21074 TaxID=1121955 RepID=A0A1M6B6D3_9BACT|nr:HAMP domain-containing histidine kinase [Hymenobacter daecheongensis]SHI44033.1 Signal transduction histidine kinase [Hymenobacter daecheongensis DSM 21074]
MSLKLKIRLSIFLLLLLLLGLGGYAFFTMRYLENGAGGLEQADFDIARGTVLAFLVAGTAVGITMMVRLPRMVVRPLHRLTVDVERVAGPDAATRVAVGKRDEVGSVAAAVNRVLSQAQAERRLTLAELFAERNRMESLVRSLDEGLLLLDEHGTIVLANPVACDLLGRPAAELLGQSAEAVAATCAPLREWLVPLAEANLAGDNVPDPVFTFPHHPRAPHYQLSISPIEAATPGPGQPAGGGHILCLRNVSDFKKLDETKSAFLATISHELKTPLASINLSLMLLQNERTDPAERQRIASGIREETQRLLQMVGQLIDVSRLDAGADIKLNVQPVTLADVVRYATDTVRPQLDDKQLRLDMHLPETLPAAHADVEKTTWVLINLLANAIRYSPPDETLLLRAVPWGDMVRVSIHDHGPGIAPEYHKRIFQRFAELPASVGQRQGSSGLGLSISREFITAQGGQLWVESAAGRGSIFLFTLPLVT